MIEPFEYEGPAEIANTGEVSDEYTIYLEFEDGTESLTDELAKHFAAELIRTDGFYEATGQLRIKVELVREFKLPKPRPSREFSLYKPGPKCNCVHTGAPDEHHPYCAVWGGKRLSEWTHAS
jgi:hypothetical protein